MIQKPKIAEARDIQRLINMFAEEGRLIPRSLSDIYDYWRDFFVYKEPENPLKGVCALHIYWEDLAEIRSLAVTTEDRGKGIGERLIRACIQEARALEIPHIFVLTYIPSYFERFGFHVVDKSTLPQKIWRDCIKCVKFPDCDETALTLSLDRQP